LVLYPELNGRAEEAKPDAHGESSTSLKDSQFGKDLWVSYVDPHFTYGIGAHPASFLITSLHTKGSLVTLPSMVTFMFFGSKCFIKVPEETRTNLMIRHWNAA